MAVVKETRYHGIQEEFDNVYYYDGPTFQAGDANYKALADALVAAEREVHTSEVKFKNVRVWSAGGTIVENVTLGIYDYNLTGLQLGALKIHAEAAVMVEWECGRSNVLGRKVYLRKYIRSQALTGGTDDMARGKDLLSTGVLSPYKEYADKVDQVGIPFGPIFDLVSPTGRTVLADNIGKADIRLRTREFRRN